MLHFIQCVQFVSVYTCTSCRFVALQEHSNSVLACKSGTNKGTPREGEGESTSPIGYLGGGTFEIL